MISRALLLIFVVFSLTLSALADDTAPAETPEELSDFVASFNLGRPKDFPPLLVEDILCSRELKSENTTVVDAFPHLPDSYSPKAQLMSEDKPKLRQFRKALAEVVARRKEADIKQAAAQSTRFGPTFRELGQNILTIIADIDTALKLEAPGAYFMAARRVREDAEGLAQTSDHSSRAFRHLVFEYQTVMALSQGKPRPTWHEPKPYTPSTPSPQSNSPLDLHTD